MPRSAGRWWSLVLLFGGRNPKDPLGRFGPWIVTAVLGGLWARRGTPSVPLGGAVAFEAIKKRTRLGPLDDQAPSYEVLLRTVGGWFAQDRLSQIRSSALRNSPSLRGLASFRFQKTLPIHQICRPAKARATRPSWRYPQFSFSISPLRSPVPRSVPKSA